MNEDNLNKQAKKLLQKYLNGQCTPEEEQQVIEWFYSFGDELPSAEEDSTDSLKRSKTVILDQIQREEDTLTSSGFFTWKRMLVAAVILVVMGGLLGIYLKSNNTTQTVDLAAVIPDSSGQYKNDIMPGSSYAVITYPNGKRKTTVDSGTDQNLSSSAEKGLLTIEVPKAGKYKLTLNDGTNVWLNSSSVLSYPTVFDSDQRIVKLSGEAYFDVAKDTDRPFRIELNGSVIEVLGTSFNVNAYTDEISTSLVEGKVKIITGQKETFLSPGNEALIKGNDVAVAPADIQKNTAWQRDEFYFDSDNLSEIIKEVARWYDVEIVNAGSLTVNTTYKGAISREAKLSEVLNILSSATQRRFEIDGRKVIVK
ncbi:FecR domain-containing protein [Sphingobacterium spiritivorum]|uniref:Sigma factor regulatory protein, FecR/PupR family n=1 Tax=Sphingobacterium spiritivorum ATCC 33861 TaxID=525373 RepID=D7VK14_SPHSI|nr:FecR domain-containing protein [Sphingobacterium spiritivorum]EFK58616.1 sigma factor regulatory protein, FecR/PupR family [Sphingobacterium spiritivorum ATCC 33861]QQT34478.1 FecR family protein [Sphingobacterium spiritivorum]WQD35337.1 FecR domain-containing protein [Sphingobacterium spiritivorum]SUI99987.1 fec operon regulator FecR [Sphingobacterium spiritivorum]